MIADLVRHSHVLSALETWNLWKFSEPQGDHALLMLRPEPWQACLPVLGINNTSDGGHDFRSGSDARLESEKNVFGW